MAEARDSTRVRLVPGRLWFGRIVPDVIASPDTRWAGRNGAARWHLRNRIKTDNHFRMWVGRTGMGTRSYQALDRIRGPRRRQAPMRLATHHQLSLAL